MRSIIRSLRVLVVALALLGAPGCTSAGSSELSPIEVPAHQTVESRVSMSEATAIAQTALEGLDEGDYELFTAAWSDDMRAAIDPAKFEEVRASTLAAAGGFVAITEARSAVGSSPEYVRFYFLCEFEAARIVYLIAFHVEGDEVVGAHLGTVAE